jgi:hypothetical protein
MKTASLPSLRVEPELRDAAESVLLEGESISSFIEASVREAIDRRRVRSEFMARGLAAREHMHTTGIRHTASDVHAELRSMLRKAQQQMGKRAAK